MTLARPYSAGVTKRLTQAYDASDAARLIALDKTLPRTRPSTDSRGASGSDCAASSIGSDLDARAPSASAVDDAVVQVCVGTRHLVDGVAADGVERDVGAGARAVPIVEATAERGHRRGDVARVEPERGVARHALAVAGDVGENERAAAGHRLEDDV